LATAIAATVNLPIVIPFCFSSDHIFLDPKNPKQAELVA
jgi:hypothetical protein